MEAATPDTLKVRTVSWRTNLISNQYSTILSAYARQGDHIQAEQVLDMMLTDFSNGNQQAAPNQSLFETIITACIKHDDLALAEKTFVRMWHHSQPGPVFIPNIRPTAKTYERLIKKNHHDGNIERAESLMWEMERSKISLISKDMLSMILEGWHKSKSKNKSHRLKELRKILWQRFGGSGGRK